MENPPLAAIHERALTLKTILKSNVMCNETEAGETRYRNDYIKSVDPDFSIDEAMSPCSSTHGDRVDVED